MSTSQQVVERNSPGTTVLSVTADRYLGIDPGLVRTGYAILERSQNGPAVREGGVIRSTTRLSLAERVAEIGRGVREVIEEYQPNIMAIEQVFSLVRNPKSAILAHLSRPSWRGSFVGSLALEISKIFGVPTGETTPKTMLKSYRRN